MMTVCHDEDVLHVLFLGYAVAQSSGEQEQAQCDHCDNKGQVGEFTECGGYPFKSLRMRTDGLELYSYNLCIGDTDPKTDDKIVHD